MLIKFKLQEENPTVPGYSELQVTECTYNQQTINRIILALTEESKTLIKGGINKSFVIQNLHENEIESSGATLKINSPKARLTPLKTDFLFAVQQIKPTANYCEIELAYIHLWNGEKIKKIHLLDSSNQYRNLIEENKDKYLFKLNKIKNYNLIPADQTSKILTIQTNFDFQLNIAIPWQINLEVPVKELKALNNNTYLFATGGGFN